MTKCIDCEHGPCYIHMTNNNFIEINEKLNKIFWSNLDIEGIEHENFERPIKAKIQPEIEAFIQHLLTKKDQEHKAELEEKDKEIEQLRRYLYPKRYNQ